LKTSIVVEDQASTKSHTSVLSFGVLHHQFYEGFLQLFLNNTWMLDRFAEVDGVWKVWVRLER